MPCDAERPCDGAESLRCVLSSVKVSPRHDGWVYCWVQTGKTDLPSDPGRDSALSKWDLHSINPTVWSRFSSFLNRFFLFAEMSTIRLSYGANTTNQNRRSRDSESSKTISLSPNRCKIRQVCCLRSIQWGLLGKSLNTNNSKKHKRATLVRLTNWKQLEHHWMPTVTCMFRGPQPEGKCSVCVEARYACTHNAFMWRCVFELQRKGGPTGVSKPRQEACLPAPQGYRPVWSPQTSRLSLRTCSVTLFAKAKRAKNAAELTDIQPSATKCDYKENQKATSVNRAGSGAAAPGESSGAWLKGRLLTDSVWGEVGEEIRSCLHWDKRNDSAQFPFFPRDENLAHVWMIDKLVEAGRIRTGSGWMEQFPISGASKQRFNIQALIQEMYR